MAQSEEKAPLCSARPTIALLKFWQGRVEVLLRVATIVSWTSTTRPSQISTMFVFAGCEFGDASISCSDPQRCAERSNYCLL